MSSVSELIVFRIEHRTKNFGPFSNDDAEYKAASKNIDFWPFQDHRNPMLDTFQEIPDNWVFASKNINYLYNILSYEFLIFLQTQGFVMRKYNAKEYIAMDSEVIFNPSTATELMSFELL